MSIKKIKENPEIFGLSIGFILIGIVALAFGIVIFWGSAEAFVGVVVGCFSGIFLGAGIIAYIDTCFENERW